MTRKAAAKFNTAAPDRPAAIEVTRQHLARLIGATPDRITRFVSEGLPVLRVGSGRGNQTVFDLGAVLPWLLQRRTGALDTERTRHYKLMADKLAQELRARAGELVEASEVEHRWSGMITAARERLLSVPAVALQQHLIAPDAEDALIALVDDALTELARGRDAQRA